MIDRADGGRLRENGGLHLRVNFRHPKNPARRRGLTRDFNKGDLLSGMEKLFRARDRDPSAGRAVGTWLIVFRVVVGIFSRIESELDRRRRGVIDSDLEILVGMGLEPE